MTEAVSAATTATPKKRRKPQVVRLKDEEIADALSRSGGLFSPAAQLLGCDRATIYRRVDASESLQALCAKIKEQTIDLAEHRLMQKIGEGNMTAIIFYLKCQAKARGYVERQEMSGPNGGPMQQQIAWVDVDKHRARLLEAERLEAERAAAGSA